MLKITKKVEYALVSLKYLRDEKKEGLVTAREICSKFQTPFDTTSKVMQAMNNAGILKSSQGTKGGYALQKNLKEISYMELVSIVDPKSLNDEFCLTSKGRCEMYSTCNIVSPIEKLNVTLNNYLKNLNIYNLFEMAFSTPLTPETQEEVNTNE